MRLIFNFGDEQMWTNVSFWESARNTYYTTVFKQIFTFDE